MSTNRDCAKRTAIFCDRDGTLIRDVGYLRYPNQVELLPGAAAALAVLRSAGFVLLVVSNQSGVGRGLITRAQAEAVDHRFQKLFEGHGVKLDGSYYCCHSPMDNCECRKPAPGMLLRAGSELRLDLSHSWMIGDKQADIDAGRRAGCRTAWIRVAEGAAAWQRVVRRILVTQDMG